jgi:biopolymer transport protein TolR
MGMGSIGGKGRKSLNADINVTPLVDVMLVLLIIFMVTAPMMTQGIDINLPKTTAAPLRQEGDKPLAVMVSKDGRVRIGESAEDVSLFLQQRLEELPLAKKQEPIYLQADEDVPYGRVAEVMAQIKHAGFEKLGMVTMNAEDGRQEPPPMPEQP